MVLQAWMLVGVVRLGLWLLPFARLRRMVAQRSSVEAGRLGYAPLPLERVVWAVVASSRVVPHATCLTQALAGRMLLARHGYPSRLHIGVARGEAGSLEAHAWLESGDRVVIGDQQLERFTPLLALDGERS